MRCDNCGWKNPQDNARCAKCNAPLSNEEPSTGAAPAVMPSLKNTVFEKKEKPLAKTLKIDD
jgi:predicted ATP-dependent serine protease